VVPGGYDMTSRPERLPIAYLGPAFTNTYEAALRLFGQDSAYLPCSTITRVFDAVDDGEAEIAVVPIENSIEGTVRETVDNLIVHRPLIAREFELPIEHCLVRANFPSLEGATRILSHVQALSQCRRWLDSHCPDLERIAVSSTAQAAHDAQKDPSLVAIASPSAARDLKLRVIEPNISDQSDNATRFVVISSHDAPPSPHGRLEKTSLVFVAPHERGGLRKVLGVFDDRGVNLTRIESRPLVGLHGPRWEYAFVVDAEGHRLVEPLKTALEELEQMGALVKVLGSYPKAASSAHALDVSGAHALDVSGATL
jgi:chorismate mutase / prephenate dehydratase